jgi:transcriptional regulator with XRE-family HTH domain
MEELARRAAVSAQTVRKAERGEHVSDVTKARLAKALGGDLEKIFG